MTKSSHNLEQIISDLLEIDPSLDRAQLQPIVEKLLADRPEGLHDEQFKATLYQRLQDEIGRMSKQERVSTINFNFMKKLNFVLGGTALVAIALLAYFTTPKNSQVLTLSGKQEITKISANAFGSLNQVSTNNRNQSGGGSANAVAESSKMSAPAGMGGGSGVSSDAMLFAPTYYKYVYQGDEFTVDSDTEAVFERLKGFGSNINLQAFLSRFSIGSFNIAKFGQSQLEYLRTAENRDMGYALNLDMKEGTVSIDQNWEKWQQVYPQCSTDLCYEQTRIKPEEVLSDEESIGIANAFMDEYGINKENLGTPYVQNNWRIEYARSTDKSSVYIPDAVSVIYPMKIEGNEIYDESGNKAGIYVSVNVRVKKVTNVGPLTDQRFQASDYPVERDTKRLIGIAEKGGGYGYMPFVEDGSGVTKELYLGTPKRGYVRLWHTVGNQSKELYVPSLIFPITNAVDSYQTDITVPLVKDILDARENSGFPGDVRIMQ